MRVWSWSLGGVVLIMPKRGSCVRIEQPTWSSTAPSLLAVPQSMKSCCPTGNASFGKLITMAITFTLKKRGKIKRIIAHPRIGPDLLRVLQAIDGDALQRGVIV